MKKYYLLKQLSLASLMVFSLSHALASEEESTFFKQYDTNKDDMISFDEYYNQQHLMEEKRMKEMIDMTVVRCDTNKDGLIAKSELLKEEEISLKIIEGSFDMDKTCTIMKENIELHDSNNDGFITKEELYQNKFTYNQPKQQEILIKRDAEYRVKQFHACDTNSDKRLQWREAYSMGCNLNMFSEQFDAYDTNHDSVLTIKEIGTVVKDVHYHPKLDDKTLSMYRHSSPIDCFLNMMPFLDKNDDKRLSKSEAKRSICKDKSDTFDANDINHDNYIDLKEVDRMYIKKDFYFMDKNKDDYLNKREFLVHEKFGAGRGHHD